MKVASFLAAQRPPAAGTGRLGRWALSGSQPCQPSQLHLVASRLFAVASMSERIGYQGVDAASSQQHCLSS